MTDPEIADVTYIEPLNVERLEQIIAKERPDALLPNLGGQSGLNLCSELAAAGVLDRYNVKVIGVQVDAIERGEDRIEFKKTMNKLGIEMARSEVAYSVEDALAIADKLGYPVVLRPAYTMGGAGGGLVYNVEELKTVCERGLQASLVGQVLVEESILGWEELELEVVRDAKNNMITVCFIENIDPLGVHTGDSFCSAPMLTISEDVQKELQRQAYKIVEEVEVIGGTNVQFAHDPKSGRIIVIEINPRTSRSSALASKATGFPIALVSAMLASGLTLDEIPCGKYGTLDKYVPDGDYVVIKFARWAFEKFKGVQDKLGTQMRAVGEVMSIGKTYKEAFQKAIRSLEIGRYGLGFAKDFHEKSKEELLKMLEERLKEQTEEHNGGNYWVGTQGRTPWGNSGWHPNGIRIGGQSMHRTAMMVAGERKFRDFRKDNKLDTRQFQMAFRTLRQLSAQEWSAEKELDVDATIHDTCESAGRLEIRYKNPRKNTVKVLLLMDSGGSMDYYSGLCSQLFQAATKSNHFKELHTYYFHNCIYGDVYNGPRLWQDGQTPTEWLLQNFDASYKVILVGDAAMNPYELREKQYDWRNQRYGPSGLEWLELFKKHFPYLIWLNPEPLPAFQDFWTLTHLQLAKMFPMFDLSAEGLEQGMKRLMVRR